MVSKFITRPSMRISANGHAFACWGAGGGGAAAEMNVITERYSLYCGDCVPTMRGFPDNSFDTCITDPPYGLSKQPDMMEVLRHWMNGDDYQATGGGFMGKSWDSFVPGPATWKEVYRVLKPGGFCLVFAGTRTYDLMTLALRLAGFEIRDCCMWLHGQGMPKGANISKHIDAHLGAEREVIGYANRSMNGSVLSRKKQAEQGYRPQGVDYANESTGGVYTAPATDAARLWAGWHTGLSPAWEPIIVAMKPLTSTFAANALAHGVAGLNIDGCRVASNGEDLSRPIGYGGIGCQQLGNIPPGTRNDNHPAGRWPANLILSQSAAALLDEMSGELTSGGGNKSRKGNTAHTSVYGNYEAPPPDIREKDTGGASRYFTVLPDSEPRIFYCAKSSTAERNEGLDGLEPQVSYTHNHDGRDMSNPKNAMGGGERARVERGEPAYTPRANIHPTCKPVSLLRWLVRLTKTPTGGSVLDPFLGSGTTIVAAMLEGRHCTGIEREPDYFEIARHRAEHWQDEADTAPRKLRGKDSDIADMPLFAELQGD